MLLEIASANGYFDITFVQEWSEDIYFNAFLKEIASNGIDYDLIYSCQIRASKYDLPKASEE